MGYEKLSLIDLPLHGDIKPKKKCFLQALCVLDFVIIACDNIILIKMKIKTNNHVFFAIVLTRRKKGFCGTSICLFEFAAIFDNRI